MRLWLASYPRSGNTFLRSVLNQSFDIKSTSVYPAENANIEGSDWFADCVGYAGSLDNVAELNLKEKWVGVKTHDLPPDDGPAIYVVRDGRAAVVSYLHYLNAFERPPPPATHGGGQLMSRLRDLQRTYGSRRLMSSIIRGSQWPGSWSAHFEAWSPQTRPNTLLLRYEEMLSDPDSVCGKISVFLGVPQLATFKQNFSQLHSRDPNFFRAANNERSIAELAPHMALFERLHGGLMRELNYVPAAGPCRSVA